MDSNYWRRRPLTRRAVLRSGAVGAIGLGAAALIGCGSEDKPGTGAPAASKTAAPAVAPLKFKRGGIVRMGTPAISTGLDPVFSGAGTHKTRLAFDTLMDIDEKGIPAIRDDALALNVEQVDP